jgi:NAD(P)-dependent dehydrogenase (short-subunit alcohol dehydrogenase family)
MKISLKPLSQQTIVITGATSGIGLATAQAAAKRGANLVLAARNEEVLAKTVRELEESGVRAPYVVTDVGISPIKPGDREKVLGVNRQAQTARSAHARVRGKSLQFYKWLNEHQTFRKGGPSASVGIAWTDVGINSFSFRPYSTVIAI